MSDSVVDKVPGLIPKQIVEAVSTVEILQNADVGAAPDFNLYCSDIENRTKLVKQYSDTLGLLAEIATTGQLNENIPASASRLLLTILQSESFDMESLAAQTTEKLRDSLVRLQESAGMAIGALDRLVAEAKQELVEKELDIT